MQQPSASSNTPHCHPPLPPDANTMNIIHAMHGEWVGGRKRLTLHNKRVLVLAGNQYLLVPQHLDHPQLRCQSSCSLRAALPCRQIQLRSHPNGPARCVPTGLGGGVIGQSAAGATFGCVYMWQQPPQRGPRNTAAAAGPYPATLQCEHAPAWHKPTAGSYPYSCTFTHTPKQTPMCGG